ncbi:MAG: DUF1598 domain-containing protein [Planctomycetia bacterium]|nr:DUF1598 domain-containing protein [Planctomycetia bacterium]
MSHAANAVARPSMPLLLWITLAMSLGHAQHGTASAQSSSPALLLDGSQNYSVQVSLSTVTQRGKIEWPVLPMSGEIWSREIDGFPFHIYARPGLKPDAETISVLILGAGSGPEKVRDATRYLDPSSSHIDSTGKLVGRRYDVIIGIGDEPGWWDLLVRVAPEHLSQSWVNRQARALEKAIRAQFGVSLKARSVAAHSNGTPVAIASLENRQDDTLAFAGHPRLHLMGPDIGLFAQYVNKRRLADLIEARAIQSAHVHVIRGDLIPSIGWATKNLPQVATRAIRELGEEWPLSGSLERLALNAAEGLKARRELAGLGRGKSTGTAEGLGREGDNPAITYTEYDNLGLIALDAVRFKTHDLAMYLPLISDLVKSSGPATSADLPWDPQGVQIHVDDAILSRVLTSDTSRELAVRLDRLGRRLAEARGDEAEQRVLGEFEAELKGSYKALRPQTKLDSLVVISLRGLVEEAETEAPKQEHFQGRLLTPGSISRIHGFVLDPQRGDVLLLGRRVAGAPPIELDDLIVGLRAAWKDNQVPACSLDPDPDNFGGPQWVRVHGVAEDSGFARTMLDADYKMKRVLFGVERVNVPGYVTEKELITEEMEQHPGSARFWLYPIQPEPGDIQVSSDGQVAIFNSAVQVLSEEMMRLREGLVGTGKNFGTSEQAAASFTQHYEAIARQHPIFAKLHGLFDIVLLGRVWQRMGVTSPLLDRLCELPYRQVEIPKFYEGVTVQWSDGERGLGLQGGVQVPIGAGRRTWLTLDDAELKTIRQEARRSPGRLFSDLEGVTVHVAAPDVTRRDVATLAIESALRHLAKGEYTKALEAADRAVGSRPFDPEPFVVRAMVHSSAGNLDAGRFDARRARELEPDGSDTAVPASVLLAQADLLQGQPKSALREVDYALRLAPMNPWLHVLRAKALQQLENIDDARDACKHAIQADPTFALAHLQLAYIELQEGWPSTAKRHVKKAEQYGTDLPDVKVAVALLELRSDRGDVAKAERLAQEALADSTFDDIGAKMTAYSVLALARFRLGDEPAARENLRKAAKVIPNSPMVLQSVAQVAEELGFVDDARGFREQADRLSPRP